jgi:hypothetical protein
MRRLSPDELDAIGTRLEAIAEEAELLRLQVKEQIENFGSIPPRAEKSRRLETEQFQFTLSSSCRTEIKDAEVERIKELCPRSIFDQMFCAVIKYKLASGVMKLLAGTLPEEAPRNLRKLYAQAVETIEGPPRLIIKRLVGEEVEAS